VAKGKEFDHGFWRLQHRPPVVAAWISIGVNIPTFSAKTQKRKEAKVGESNLFVLLSLLQKSQKPS